MKFSTPCGKVENKTTALSSGHFGIGEMGSFIRSPGFILSLISSFYHDNPCSILSILLR